MHLNHLAGLLPFFEPSIEWDDSNTYITISRLERPASRGLHTFVPLPPSAHPPTMVSHGGIPSHMIGNPEPNLRPFSTTSRPSCGRMTTSQVRNNEIRNPVPIEGHAIDPSPGTFLRHRSSSCHHPDHSTGSCSVKTTGLINRGPTTEEETKINVGSRIHCHCKVWPPCASSHHLRNPS